MRESQMWKLLALAATVDNRNVTAEQVGGWMAAVGHLEYEACVRALWEHRRTSTEYLQPAHIAALVAAPQEVDALELERQAHAAFVRYTGCSAVEAARYWYDDGWRQQQLDVARERHMQAALEAGAAL